MTLPSRIFLIGLPGSGKSTTGTFLAKELNYSFLDMDRLIEKETEMPIAEIFENEGEDYFRQIETKQLRQVKSKNLVVATGGGAPCFHNNMQWMNEHGFTLFLNPPIETIVARVASESHRPLIGKNAEKSLNNLLLKRASSYSQAGMESDRSEPCEVMAELLNYFSD